MPLQNWSRISLKSCVFLTPEEWYLTPAAFWFLLLLKAISSYASVIFPDFISWGCSMISLPSSKILCIFSKRFLKWSFYLSRLPAWSLAFNLDLLVDFLTLISLTCLPSKTRLFVGSNRIDELNSLLYDFALLIFIILALSNCPSEGLSRHNVCIWISYGEFFSH